MSGDLLYLIGTHDAARIDDADVRAYWHPNSVFVVDAEMAHKNPDALRAARAAGAAVLLYVDDMEWRTGGSAGLEWEIRRRKAGKYTIGSYLGIGDVRPEWIWPGSPSNYQGSTVADVRRADLRAHLAEETAEMIDRYPDVFDGIWSDNHGNRLWSSWWRGLAASTQAEWAAAMYDLGLRYRAALGPDFLLVGNNLMRSAAGWPTNGHPAFNGMAYENHPYTANDVNSLKGYTGAGTSWHSSGRRFHMIVGEGTESARQYAAAFGAGFFVSTQGGSNGNYTAAPAPVPVTPDVWPSGLYVDPWGITPPPPPDLPADPCADVKAQLATAIAERDDARAIGLELKGRIDRAKADLG